MEHKEKVFIAEEKRKIMKMEKEERRIERQLEVDAEKHKEQLRLKRETGIAEREL